MPYDWFAFDEAEAGWVTDIHVGLIRRFISINNPERNDNVLGSCFPIDEKEKMRRERIY